jgi:hypothetical protein
MYVYVNTYIYIHTCKLTCVLHRLARVAVRRSKMTDGEEDATEVIEDAESEDFVSRMEDEKWQIR